MDREGKRNVLPRMLEGGGGKLNKRWGVLGRDRRCCSCCACVGRAVDKEVM